MIPGIIFLNGEEIDDEDDITSLRRFLSPLLGRRFLSILRGCLDGGSGDWGTINKTRLLSLLAVVVLVNRAVGIIDIDGDNKSAWISHVYKEDLQQQQQAITIAARAVNFITWRFCRRRRWRNGVVIPVLFCSSTLGNGTASPQFLDFTMLSKAGSCDDCSVRLNPFRWLYSMNTRQ